MSRWAGPKSIPSRREPSCGPQRAASRAGRASALSVRAVAREAGTTTRAVYSLFGSRDGLLVDALAQGAFEFLFDEIGKLPETDDPAGDLIAVGALAFRRLVLEHPAGYRVAFQRVAPGLQPGPELTAARSRAWSQLNAKVQRLADTNLLGTKPVRRPPSSSTRCSKA